MIKKILLAIFLTLAGGLTASAQELTYIGVQGSWWNQEYAGEGFAIEEYGDGFIIAYWYTYSEMGQQMWLMGTGQREGNTVELEMLRTHGGAMADAGNPEFVSEEVWGTVTLQVNDCGHIEMSYESVTGVTGGYPISRLLPKPLAAGACNGIELEGPDQPEPPPETDPPVEDPPVEDPPEEEPAEVNIRLQKRDATGGWQDVEIPFTGLAVINKSYGGNPDRITLFSFRIVAEEGDLVFGNIIASEPTGIAQPSVEGVTPGWSFQEGSIVGLQLDSNPTGGERVYPWYNVHVEGVGEIINLTVRLSTTTH